MWHPPKEMEVGAMVVAVMEEAAVTAVVPREVADPMVEALKVVVVVTAMEAVAAATADPIAVAAVMVVVTMGVAVVTRVMTVTVAAVK